MKSPKSQVQKPNSQRRQSHVWVLGFGICVLGFALASAQSLGDVAKREEARRKTVKAPSKVYTNDDLRSEGSSPAPSGQSGTASGSQPAAAPAAGQPKEGDKSAADDPKKTEAYWKDRLAKARGDLDRAKTFADALQSRINALTTDFAARSDPAQRAQIGNDRQKALAELDRVKKEIEADTKAITDIQEEGRKAGVPAGWVR
jgi:hypothetical protein